MGQTHTLAIPLPLEPPSRETPNVDFELSKDIQSGFNQTYLDTQSIVG